GPASVREIANWAGLPYTTLLPAIGRLSLRHFRDEKGRELLDLPRAPLPAAATPAPVRFLPTWDATLLAHARRTQILPERYRALVVASLAHLAVSIAAAGQITQPHHASVLATTARAVADFENVAFKSRVDHLQLKGWLFKTATQSNRHSAVIVHGHDTNRVN